MDTSGVNIPARIKRHNVEYIEIVSPDEDDDGNIICTCMQCSTVATSYEAIVKANHLNFKDTKWYPKFKDIALEQAPDKPGSDTDSITDDDNDSDSGLMAFKS